MTTKVKKGFITTPSGDERSIQMIHGALLCEETIVLTGSDSQNIDFQQYDSIEEAGDVFRKLANALSQGEVVKGNRFIELPNGNLLRKEQIMAIELITNAYEGFILRNRKDQIVDFVAESDVGKREIIKAELLKSLEEKTGRAKGYQPEWKKLLG
ncbi:hypothetical protein FCV44_19440 [Vibrio kanaloae]|uniref:hypothetical protein n=1 Tax=Vibrio kanaloae TaxID=170673 RepID=UPI0010BED3D3|nr:hypothetical protein [Vibrio kanaloae]TKE91260.1 hypothetical protein FCV44_19440 [Vibrio kanaloae]TKF12875.1 hypothetical protein FCV47_19855 [Vibrio kanaloae]